MQNFRETEQMVTEIYLDGGREKLTNMSQNISPLLKSGGLTSCFTLTFFHFKAVIGKKLRAAETNHCNILQNSAFPYNTKVVRKNVKKGINQYDFLPGETVSMLGLRLVYLFVSRVCFRLNNKMSKR